MFSLIGIGAFIGGCLLCIFIFRVRKFIRNLVAAMESKHHLLKNKPSVLWQWMGLEQAITQVNRLIDSHNEYSDTQSGKLKQLEATVGSIQEAVIIFSDNRIVEYANKSARQLFRQGEDIKGLRLESVLRSPELIDCIVVDSVHQSCNLKQVSLEQQGSVRWFEVSCGEVRDIDKEENRSTLLVLHDISRLKSLEEIRRDFVANVSHELRTPLTIIKGFAETLIQDNQTLAAEKRLRFLEKIEKNTHRLHLLVEDLLELSRLESRPDQLKLLDESLQDLLNEIIENYQSRVDLEKQQIELTFDPRVGRFKFDRFRIQQVFDNLIENVFSYAPEFTQLRVSVSFDEALNRVQCTVADDGPGIPEKDLPHIFERFYRVDKGRSYEGGGTGLGLSIIKHIVQQHGGTVLAESNPGEGTKIHFFLPFETVKDV